MSFKFKNGSHFVNCIFGIHFERMTKNCAIISSGNMKGLWIVHFDIPDNNEGGWVGYFLLLVFMIVYLCAFHVNTFFT